VKKAQRPEEFMGRYKKITERRKQKERPNGEEKYEAEMKSCHENRLKGIEI